MSAPRPVKEIKLGTPIQNGSETIEVLHLRKPVAKDLRGLPASPNFGDLLNLAAVLADQPVSVIDRLEVEDALRVNEVVGSFFPDSQATGA